MESEPVRFFTRELETLAEEARTVLARFVGCRPADLVFVRNATEGVNTVLRSLELEPGDELLTTDHAYPACRNALEHVASRSGATVVVAPVPFPIESEERVVGAVEAAASPRTRIALIDHVTSPTGLVLPVASLVRRLAGKGIDTLVDGAHAPGMLPLDVEGIGAAYYAGNCHKWICSPKGAGFLHVRPDRQEGVVPLTISHGWSAPTGNRSRFRILFDWTGTEDPTPHLCVTEAIRWMGNLHPGGWDELRRRNRETALLGRALLAEALGCAPPCPDGMIGSLAALPIPDGSAAPPGPPPAIDPLQERLFAEEGIEVPVVAWPRPPARLVRISAQAYNRVDQYEKLASALVRRLGL
jgi:isopenicillin-N epimerase